MRILAFTFVILALFRVVSPAAAMETPLAMDQAFKATVERGNDGRAIIRWAINDGYYLYRDYLSAEGEDGRKLEIQSLPGEMKEDPSFGFTEIYYKTATASIGEIPPDLSGLPGQGALLSADYQNGRPDKPDRGR